MTGMQEPAVRDGEAIKHGAMGGSKIMPDPVEAGLFHDDAILEQACEQLEEIWDSQWHGEGSQAPEAIESGGKEKPATSAVEGAEKAEAKDEPRGMPRFFRRLKQTLRTLGKKGGGSEDVEDVEERIDSMMTYRVPRFPSWAEWSDEHSDVKKGR